VLVVQRARSGAYMYKNNCYNEICVRELRKVILFVVAGHCGGATHYGWSGCMSNKTLRKLWCGTPA
jgi:hypothetical protein